jgi:chromosome segregation ATPase
MAGIYEALVRADEQRHPSEAREPAEAVDTTSRDLAAVGAMLRRLEARVETEISVEQDDAFERFASLQVSIGALEDRLYDREREEEAASTNLAEVAEVVERLAGEIGALTGRIDREFLLLRAELGRSSQRRGVAGLCRRLLLGSGRTSA